MAKLYYIGNLEFKTKISCKKYVQNIINTLGITIINNQHIKYDFFLNLLNNHPNAIEKIGIGIDYFYIQSNVMNKKYYQTMIKRLDGSHIDFSYIVCCEFKERSTIYNLTVAMRRAISQEIINYKQNNKLICSFCKIENESYENYHVDHDYPSFANLKDDFLNQTTKIKPTTFDRCKIYFLKKFHNDDYEFETDWITFHNNNCKLQILCRDCNLKKG